MDKQAIIDAVKFDMESRIYYWKDEMWMPKTADPALVTGMYKGTVPNVQSLPMRGNVAGDYYVTGPSTATIAMTDGRVMEGFGKPPVTRPADQIKGKLTLHDTEPGAVANYHSDRITDTIRRFVITALTDEKLALVVDSNRNTVLMSYAEAHTKANECGLSVVKAIEVNKLQVETQTSIDGFEVEVTYGNLSVRIDSSALQ